MLQNSSRKCFRPIFAIETELRVPFQRQLTCCLCYSYFSCLITVSLFLCFLKIITEACSRASIEDRLRSPNGLGLKWPLLCRKAVSGSFPPGIPPPLSAYKCGVLIKLYWQEQAAGFSLPTPAWRDQCLLCRTDVSLVIFLFLL